MQPTLTFGQVTVNARSGSSSDNLPLYIFPLGEDQIVQIDILDGAMTAEQVS